MHRQSTSHHDAPSRAFHWLTAILVATAFILGPGGLGRLMRQGIDPATRSDIVWHETPGLSVLAPTVLRLRLGGVRIDQLPVIAISAIARPADWGDVHQSMLPAKRPR